MPDELPRAHFDRLKRQLQDSILRGYPNPERRGCPGARVLQELARRPLDDNLESDSDWQHITHCSECYREFLDVRTAMKRRQKTRQVTIGLGLAAAVALAAFVVFSNRQAGALRSDRPQVAEQIYRPLIIDLESHSMTRSAKGKDETNPLLLGREPEQLIIRLPFGSKAGTYEIQFLKTPDRPLLSVTSKARLDNGVPALTTRVDLSKYEPGKYYIGVRQVPWDWTYYPTLLQ
jgi:hypothetical protein